MILIFTLQDNYREIRFKFYLKCDLFNLLFINKNKFTLFIEDNYYTVNKLKLITYFKYIEVQKIILFFQNI